MSWMGLIDVYVEGKKAKESMEKIKQELDGKTIFSRYDKETCSELLFSFGWHEDEISLEELKKKIEEEYETNVTFTVYYCDEPNLMI